MTKLDLDIDAAARARASVVTEGEIGFDMLNWYECGTLACLAGHIHIANGGEVEMSGDLVRAYQPTGGMSWEKAAFQKLFPGNAFVNHEFGAEWGTVWEIFHATKADKEEVLDQFDSWIKGLITEEEYQLYLSKSYGYQAHMG